MPSGIYLPPWLQPVDRIGPFMQGVSQGVNMARTALAAQAQQFEAQQQQQQLALRQQQEERAVATAVAGVIAQKEEQKRQQQLIDLKAQQAAQQYAGVQGFEADVAAGVPEPQALMKWAPRMGINPQALMAAEMRRPQRMIDTTQNLSGRDIPIQIDPETGKRFYPPVGLTGSEESPAQKSKVEMLMAEYREAIRKANESTFDKQTEIRFRDRAKDIKKQIDKLYSKPSASATVTEQPKTDEVLSLPRSKDKLIEGKRYRTDKGILTWDGERFVK